MADRVAYIVVVGGDARNDGGDVTGEGHAWNAARIGGHWVLLDATWDAGNVKGDRFEKDYGTEYLFAPPQVQGVTHFPDVGRQQYGTYAGVGEIEAHSR